MDKIDIAEKEIQGILKKHGLKFGYHFNFPMYKILPDEVKLAMRVLHNHGLKIGFILKEKEEKKKE